MGKGSAPTPPDPTVTAAAQTKSNLDTATAQAQLNNVSQVTPYGNLTYTSTPGANGVPQYTATQTLSPAEQQLLDTNNITQQSLADTAQTEAGKLGGMLDTPLDLSQSNLDNYTDTHFLGQFNDQQDRAQASLTASLANQGITPGSAAYSNAMSDFSNSKNSALNNMLSSSQSNAMSAILAQRETPINEISALAGGSQVQTPNLTSTPQTSVAGTDVAGITNSAYQDQMAGYQAQQAQTQDLLGGLFGLGSAGIFGLSSGALKLSDERLKDGIEKVGELPDKTGIFEWSYKPETGLSTERQVGLVAQDAEKRHPEAVVTMPGGVKAVNYNRVVAEAMLKRKAA